MITAFLDVVLARNETWSGMVVSILFWALIAASFAGFASDWLTPDDLDEEVTTRRTDRELQADRRSR